MWQIDLPLRIPQSKAKLFTLNLNTYRNTHPMILNKAKVNFTKLVLPWVKHIPRMENIELKYVLYPKTKRLTDVANVCSIVDKFFSDVLVEAGTIPDDNYNHLRDIMYSFGEVDPLNPRVTVFISKPSQIETKEITMRIILTNEDLQQAAIDFVNKQLTVADGQVLTAVLSSATVTADVDIVDGDVAAVVPATPVKRATRTVKTTAKAEPVVEAVAAVEEQEEEEEEPAVEEAVESTVVEDALAAKAAAAEEEESEEPVAPKKSLFGGLNRPKN